VRFQLGIRRLATGVSASNAHTQVTPQRGIGSMNPGERMLEIVGDHPANPQEAGYGGDSRLLRVVLPKRRAPLCMTGVALV
jgi:hypothetical protein